MRFIFDNIFTLCINTVNFGSVTAGFTYVKYVYPIVSFFKINISDKLSQNLADQFSPNFHHMIDIFIVDY